MRVMIVNSHGNDLTVGGAERAVDMLSRGLAARGHEVSLLAAFPGGATESEMETTVLNARDWRQSPVLRAKNHAGDWLSLSRRELARAVAYQAPDVVHTHNLPGIGTGIWEVCRRYQVPVVHTLHDYHLLCPRVTLMRRDGTTPCSPHPLFCGYRTRRLARSSDAVSVVTGVSEHIVGVHEGLFPMADRRVVRLPLARPQWAAVSPPGETLRTVGYIGNLSPIKGVNLLLEAVPALAALGVELRIAGDGELVREVRAAASSYANVHYHGLVTGKAKEDFFDACDVGVIPSVWAEPGGPVYTMIEWLWSGRPVLVSRRGGLGEVVDEFAGAIAIEPSAEGILRAIERLSSEAVWRHESAHARPDVDGDAYDRWIIAHESIYGSTRLDVRVP
jgi:glycosyltransferase involved in cell wall biosynthesis